MLLAQINRDSQGMTEFSGGGMEAQHVTLCLTEAVAVQGKHSVKISVRYCVFSVRNLDKTLKLR